MQDKIKKILKKIYGFDKDIMFKFSISCLIMSLIMSVFIWIYKDETDFANYFTYVSAIFFSLWVIFTKGINSLEKFLYEFIRLVIFIALFMSSIVFLLMLTSFTKPVGMIIMILACMGVFVSCIFFISKINDIFNYIKLIIKRLKIKVFNTDKPTSTGYKALLENITVFLVSIGGFCVAIKTIFQSIFQIIDLFE